MACLSRRQSSCATCVGGWFAGMEGAAATGEPDPPSRCYRQNTGALATIPGGAGRVDRAGCCRCRRGSRHGQVGAGGRGACCRHCRTAYSRGRRGRGCSRGRLPSPHQPREQLRSATSTPRSAVLVRPRLCRRRRRFSPAQALRPGDLIRRRPRRTRELRPRTLSPRPTPAMSPRAQAPITETVQSQAMSGTRSMAPARPATTSMPAPAHAPTCPTATALPSPRHTRARRDDNPCAHHAGGGLGHTHPYSANRRSAGLCPTVT